MKKLLLFAVFAFAGSLLFPQSLEEIVKKYTVANKIEQVSKFNTIKITANVSVMGMDVPQEVWMKKPNKIKTVTTVNGEGIVSVFDGQKGYQVNPMAGSTTPVEMSAEEVANMQRGNIFTNYLANYLKEGKLALEGEEAVNGAACYKIKANENANTTLVIFLDKVTFYPVKTSVSMVSQGMPVTVDSFSSDFQETNGFIMPMKSTMSVSGMDLLITYTKVEVDIPMEDSVFQIK